MTSREHGHCRKGLIAGLAGLAILAASLAAPAQARLLGPKDCGTRQQVAADLVKEGHKLVAGMESLLVDPRTHRQGYVAIMLTANADRSAWYLIRGDRPFGALSTQYCVTAMGRSLEIFATGSGSSDSVTGENPVPAAAFKGFDRAKAEKECADLNRASYAPPECAFYDNVIERMEDVFAARPALQGQLTSRRGADRGVMTIVVDRGNERGYHQLRSTVHGATGILGFGQNFFLAPEVLEALEGGE